MENTQRLVRTLLILLAVGLAVAVFLALPNFGSSGSQEAPYSQFLSALEENRIEEASIGESEIRWRVQGSDQWRTSTRIPGVEDSQIVQRLQDSGAQITGKESGGLWPSVLIWLLPVGLAALLWFFLMRRMGGRQQQFLSFGQSQARLYNRSTSQVTFKDVAGVDEAKAELQEIVDILRNPLKYQKLGGKIPKGVILVGPPGTGKTLLARAVAGEANVPFYSISGGEFVQMFVGVGAARVRDLFEQAKRSAPSLVFIDEIETIGKLRGGATSFGGHEEREQTLNQLLSQMDGFDPSSGIIIMAATNRPDVLDPALTRPGRFDRQIVVDNPDMLGREEILNVHARKVKLSGDVDLHAIAARTPGLAGAELANVVNEAALLAARQSKDAVGMSDITEAIDRVMSGLERKSRVLSEEEKELVAYHEMGHALVALLLPHADPVQRVSIIPRGAASLGMTLQLPLQDKYLYTRDELEDRLTVLLGGRSSEEICLGRISTGAQNDLHHAAQLARRMVLDFGMSDRLGPLTFGDGSDSYGPRQPAAFRERAYSDETARIIDEEVAALVSRNRQRAIGLLQERKDILNTLAQELEEKETFEGPALRRRLEELERAATQPPVAANDYRASAG